MKPEHIDLFCSLYQEHSKWLIQWAYRLVGNYESAEEITQEAYLILLFKMDELARHPNIEGWLYKTAHNLAKRELNSARNKKEAQLNDNISAPFFEFGRNDLFEVLPEDLPDEEKALLAWCYYERMPHQEIADRMGISAAACRMRIMRAKRHCLELLEKDS